MEKKWQRKRGLSSYKSGTSLSARGTSQNPTKCFVSRILKSVESRRANKN